LCPGNQRVGGAVNPAYEGVFSFVNDFYALLPELPAIAEQLGSPLLVSRRHLGALPQLNGEEQDALADALKRLTTRYDNLFETSFPYTMGFHQSPAKGEHPE
jgi:UDPglucose--hexose-1-phosphate uridylyltransferase